MHCASYTVLEPNGAVDFHRDYSFPGEDVYERSARTLELVPKAAAAHLASGRGGYGRLISTVTESEPAGLTEAEAARRLAARRPLRAERSSRSYASIVRANTLTIPNGILLVFGVLTLTFGSWKDALFLGILVSNIAIGSFQEIRSKRALDRLAALVAPEAVVVREGADRRVPVDQLVVGDVVRLAPGDQVAVDGTVLTASGLSLDEANLTGESEAVVRVAGERGVVGLVRDRGRRSRRGDCSGPRESRGAADGDRAYVPSPALAARTGKRPASSPPGRGRDPADASR